MKVSPPREVQSYFRQLYNICSQALWHNIDNRPADWLHLQRVSLNILQLNFLSPHGYVAHAHPHMHICEQHTHITDFDLSKSSQKTKILIPTLSTIGCVCWLCKKSIVSKYADLWLSPKVTKIYLFFFIKTLQILAGSCRFVTVILQNSD